MAFSASLAGRFGVSGISWGDISTSWTCSGGRIGLPPGKGRFGVPVGAHQPVPVPDVEHLAVTAPRRKARHAHIQPVFVYPEIAEAPDVADRAGEAHGHADGLAVVLGVAQVALALP